MFFPNKVILELQLNFFLTMQFKWRKIKGQTWSWKNLMEDMLYSKDLYDPIEGDKAKSANKSNVE